MSGRTGKDVMDKRYCAGQCWQAQWPACYRAFIVLLGNGKLGLVMDPTGWMRRTGMCLMTEADGRWEYTHEELRDRLASWTHLGPYLTALSPLHLEGLRECHEAGLLTR